MSVSGIDGERNHGDEAGGPLPLDPCLRPPCFVKMLCILLFLPKALGNLGPQLCLHIHHGALLPSLREDLLLYREAPGMGAAELGVTLPRSCEATLV